MTECSETLFPFEAHFSRQVVAQFEGSWLSTEGGSLLLRQADRKIGLLRRVARCFTDYRQRERIEHRLEEMLGQRIYGLALAYEDLNDHEQLRQDPLLGVLAGKRDLSEPLAGKSTLNRLELTPAGSPAAERYNKIIYSCEAIDELLVTLFLESHRKALRSIVLDLDAPDTRCMGSRKRASSMATTTTTAICRCTLSVETNCCVHGCGPRISMPVPGASRRSTASSDSKSLAEYADHSASGLRVLPRRVE
jgi:hypothetical protein